MPINPPPKKKRYPTTIGPQGLIASQVVRCGGTHVMESHTSCCRPIASRHQKSDMVGGGRDLCRGAAVGAVHRAAGDPCGCDRGAETNARSASLDPWAAP